MSGMTWVASLFVAAVLCAATEPIKEPETGHVFDAEIKGVTPGVTLTCTGVGCRKKTALAVKVYAMAQWIDASAARQPLSAWQGKSGKDLAKDQGFYDALSSADIEKRLALVFVRDLEAAKVHEAFKESLMIVHSGKLPPGADRFLALFTTDVKKGQSIELRSLPGGVIEVDQNGAALGRLPADPELAKAVWGIYFHDKLADDHLAELKPELISRVEAIW